MTLYGPIPGKSPQFLFGNLLQTGIYRDRHINDITKQFQDEYGDTFQFWAGPTRLIFVCNPDDVEHIFTHRHIYERGHLHVNQHRFFLMMRSHALSVCILVKIIFEGNTNHNLYYRIDEGLFILFI